VIDRAAVRAVVLDIDGTILSLTKGVGEIYSELLHEHGVVSDSKALEAAARRVWTEFQPDYLNIDGGYRTTHDREREVWLSFVRRVLTEGGVPEPDEPWKGLMIYEAFSSDRFRKIEPGVLGFLQTLKALGVSAIAATNNDTRSKRVLESFGLMGLVQGAYVAGDLGWKKPSPNFYRALERATGLTPKQLLHVGNDRRLDIEEACRCGWQAILYDPKNRAVEPRFSHFDELTSLF
jgi:HAD superfamily hydrolase (TIGR01509 family)